MRYIWIGEGAVTLRSDAPDTASGSSACKRVRKLLIGSTEKSCILTVPQLQRYHQLHILRNSLENMSRSSKVGSHESSIIGITAVSHDIFMASIFAAIIMKKSSS